MTTSNALTPRSRRPVARSTARLGSALLSSLKGLLPVLALIALWQVALDDPLRFPKPDTWVPALKDLQEGGVLMVALRSSLVTYGLGLAAASVLGVVGGLLIGGSRRTERALSPLLEFLRGVPIPVVIPVVVLLVGASRTTSVLIIVLGVVWPILLSTTSAMQNVSPVRLDAAKMMGLNRRAMFAKVAFPSVFPAAIVGLRVSASLGVVVLLVVEMLQGTDGIGFLLLQRQAQFDATAVWGLLLVIGCFGYVLNAALAVAESRVLKNWPPQ